MLAWYRTQRPGDRRGGRGRERSRYLPQSGQRRITLQQTTVVTVAPILSDSWRGWPDIRSAGRGPRSLTRVLMNGRGSAITSEPATCMSCQDVVEA